ncbi:GtrA family protein [Nocardia puris]|uniref:Putative flippase GtrA n=1 Tax=Nocardia puris TaxID=208602 RepID=A0A366DHR1_9NOCA|nr:GtrA family protein [Nocardia puris]RBO89627.1 putative flippase GtrA [Nocardia puris]
MSSPSGHDEPGRSGVETAGGADVRLRTGDDVRAAGTSAAAQTFAATGESATESAQPGPLVRLFRRQEVAFALVGEFNTVFGMALAILWLTVLPEHSWTPLVAVPLAYAIGVTTAFVLHRTLVFRVRGHVLRDFAGFVAVNSGGLVLNTGLLYLAVSVFGWPARPSAVVVMGVVAVASFFGHRHISFRRRPAVEAGSGLR